MPTNIRLPGCNNEVCDFRRNVPITFDMSFIVREATNTAFGFAEALVRGTWLTLTRNEPICAHLIAGRCPLAAGSRATYRQTAQVPGFIPVGTRTTVRLRAVDSRNGIIACVRIAARVVN